MNNIQLKEMDIQRYEFIYIIAFVNYLMLNYHSYIAEYILWLIWKMLLCKCIFTLRDEC